MIPDTKFDRFEWLEKLVSQLEKENLELKKLVLALQKENADLRRRLLAYENAHTPPSKSKRKRLPRDEPSGKLGAPIGHEKYERQQPEPTSTVEHKQDSCSNCGNKLGKSFMTERRIIEDIPEPKPIEVTEHLIHHYICSCCGKKNVAPHSLPKGYFGATAEATTVLLRFEDRLPLRKAVNALKRQHLGVTNVCVQNISQRVARKLLPEYNAQIQLLRVSPVVYADETEMPIDGETYWLWAFTTEHLTVYTIQKRRNSSVPLEILGKQYNGIITSDGHTAYKKIGSAQQRCWAHIIRESKTLNEEHKLYTCHHDNIKKIFAKVKQIRANPPQLKKRVELKKQLETKATQIADALDGHKEYHTFAVKLRNAIPALFTCIIHLFVEPTNNAAERALRELIVLRKIIGGLRRENGARTLETIATMLTTWKQQEKPLFLTLKQAING